MSKQSQKRIMKLIGTFIEDNPTTTRCILEDACQYKTVSGDAQKSCMENSQKLLSGILNAYIHDPGYAITDFDNTGMLEIQRIADAGIFESDEEAVEQAIKDGIKLIPVNELPETFDRRYLGWLDTQENREAIRDYCHGKHDTKGSFLVIEVYERGIDKVQPATTRKQAVDIANTLLKDHCRSIGHIDDYTRALQNTDEPTDGIQFASLDNMSAWCNWHNLHYDAHIIHTTHETTDAAKKNETLE